MQSLQWTCSITEVDLPGLPHVPSVGELAGQAGWLTPMPRFRRLGFAWFLLDFRPPSHLFLAGCHVQMLPFPRVIDNHRWHLMTLKSWLVASVDALRGPASCGSWNPPAAVLPPARLQKPCRAPKVGNSTSSFSPTFDHVAYGTSHVLIMFVPLPRLFFPMGHKYSLDTSAGDGISGVIIPSSTPRVQPGGSIGRNRKKRRERG